MVITAAGCGGFGRCSGSAGVWTVLSLLLPLLLPPLLPVTAHAQTEPEPTETRAAAAQAAVVPPAATPVGSLPRMGRVAGPDGEYFSELSGPFGARGNRERILRRLPDGSEAAPSWSLSGASEGDPYYAAGGTLCFVSDRASPDDPVSGDRDIWCARREGDTWASAERLPEPVNSAAEEYSPVVVGAGEVMFASDRPGGHGLGDLYRAVRDSSGNWHVSNLGPPVSTRWGEWNLELAPGGDYLLFEASHRPENRSVAGDLYASRRGGRSGESNWHPPVPLSRMNTPDSDLMPRFQPGGELHWTSASSKATASRRASPVDVLPVKPLLAAVSRSSHEVVLLDPESLEELRRIEVGTGPHEIAATADGRLALVPSLGLFPVPHEQPIEPEAMRWRSGSSTGLASVDLVSGAVVQAPVPDCPRPHGAAITPQGDRAWITCEQAGVLLELDPATLSVLRRIDLGKGVHKVIYLPRSGLVAAANPDTGELHLVHGDGRIHSFVAGAGAEGLAADAEETALWVLNAQARTVCKVLLPAAADMSCVPTGGSFPIALAVDPARDRLWVARLGSRDIAGLSLVDYSVAQVIELPSPPLGMALDVRRGSLFVTLPRDNAVLRLDAVSGEVLGRAEGVMEADDLDLLPPSAFAAPPGT